MTRRYRYRVVERGNVGESVAGTAVNCASSQAEFEAFHRLGPKTQRVLNYALLPIASGPVLAYAQSRGLNPTDRKHDQMIASDLKQRMKKLTGVSYARALCERRRSARAKIL
jgi:hypothetical protein